MPQVLNSQERNQAFLKFLLFFLITSCLVVLAVFFNFKAPLTDNEWLSGQLEMMQIEEANQAKFVSKLDEAVNLLDQMNAKEGDIDLLNSKLKITIDDMLALEGNEKTLYGRMNRAIISKLNELRHAKEDIGEYLKTMQKQKVYIDELKGKLSETRTVPSKAANQ